MPHFFISYRRSDQEGRYLAHMIFRDLRSRYGEHSVFLDIDSRSPGLSFPTKVESALNRTDVVLVIIGPAWLKLLEERSTDSRDWVRYEIAQSLKRTWLPVVPVCSPGVDVPQPHQLPEELKDLAWRDGITLDPFQDLDSHLNRLLGDLDRVLEAVREEKDQLRRTRSELVTWLAWRADQLEQADLAAKQQLREVRQNLITPLLCRSGQARMTLQALIARRLKDLYVPDRA
jgi:TIR domain-containing protein